jgi:hypothetical protein
VWCIVIGMIQFVITVIIVVNVSKTISKIYSKGGATPAREHMHAINNFGWHW